MYLHGHWVDVWTSGNTDFVCILCNMQDSQVDQPLADETFLSKIKIYLSIYLSNIPSVQQVWSGFLNWRGVAKITSSFVSP